MKRMIILAKIIAVNAGSSSLKFQLFEMPEEKVITKGMIERIGLKDSVFVMSVNGERHKETNDIENHETAVAILLERLTSLGVIESLNEIIGVGHRVVHGGEIFNESVLITDELMEKLIAYQSWHPCTTLQILPALRSFKRLCLVFLK